MKRFLITFVAALLMMTPAGAQSKLNDSADNILGKYLAIQSGEVSNVLVTKEADGTYKIQVCWLEKDKDSNGKKLTDFRNPDKSLRNTPADRIVLVSGLKYIPEKKVWGNTKIYDPTRGIKANCTVKFVEDGRLSIRGQVMGIGETVYWKKLE